MINVFFDMDGTLIDSAGAIAGAVNEIRNELNLNALEKSQIMKIVNTPGVDWAFELYGLKEFDKSSFKDGFERYFLRHYDEKAELFEGIFNLLEFLKSKNCFLAIATNAPQSSLLSILSKHKITHFFDKILGVGAGIEPKPHPQMLNLLRLEAPFEKSVFIGDSQKDKECAQNANLPYFHARYGASECAEFEFKSATDLKEKLIYKFFNQI